MNGEYIHEIFTPTGRVIKFTPEEEKEIQEIIKLANADLEKQIKMMEKR